MVKIKNLMKKDEGFLVIQLFLLYENNIKNNYLFS